MVSIIAPVYNTGLYLEQCIESIIKQSFTDWELILVDDGSTDNSLNIIKKYVALNKKIKYFQSNSGCVSIARNMGLANAEGDYVYFIDSDDYMTRDCLRPLVEAANNNPSVKFFQGSFIVHNENTGIRQKAKRFEKLQEISNIPMGGKNYLKSCGLDIAYPWNSLIDKNFLITNKIEFPSDISHQEDLVFILKILLTDIGCMYVDNEGVVYRWDRAGSLTSAINLADPNILNKKKKVIKAIILTTAYLNSIKAYDKEIGNIINDKIIENVTGCLGGASMLLPDKESFNLLKQHIPNVKIRKLGLRHILALIYNISPALALYIRKIFYFNL